MKEEEWLLSIVTRLSSHYNLSGGRRSTANKPCEHTHHFQTAVPLELAAVFFAFLLLAPVNL